MVINECGNCWESDMNKFWCKFCSMGFCSEECHKKYIERFYETEYLDPHSYYEINNPKTEFGECQ